jgi:F-type H+-transporting ATPase subunit epsilon
MRLEILLPSRIFADVSDVLRIVAETRAGSLGILPHRLDCVAALAPGILTYATRAAGAVYVAVDQGVIVKSGAQVRVSVRRAIGGTSLGELHAAVKREFLSLDAAERDARAAMGKMETGLMGGFARFHRER